MPPKSDADTLQKKVIEWLAITLLGAGVNFLSGVKDELRNMSKGLASVAEIQNTQGVALKSLQDEQKTFREIMTGSQDVQRDLLLRVSNAERLLAAPLAPAPAK